MFISTSTDISGGGSLRTVSGRSHAKINLSLEVLGKLPTGYHVLQSLVSPLSLFDKVTLSLNPGGKGISCTTRAGGYLRAYLENAAQCSAEMSLDFQALSGSENLAYQAAERLTKHLEIELAKSQLEILIDKAIPWQAGLGGGSANAATVLRLLPELFAVEIERSVLFEIADSLGSDVPLQLAGSLLFVDGTGSELGCLALARQLEVEQILESFGVVLIKPLKGMPTAEAYASLNKAVDLDLAARYQGDAERDAAVVVSERNSQLLGCLGYSGGEDFGGRQKQLTYSVANGSSQVPLAGGQSVLLAQFFNDFESVVRGALPEVENCFSLLDEAGAQCRLLAGSGSAVAGFFESFERAQQVADRLRLRSGEGLFIDVCRLCPWSVSNGSDNPLWVPGKASR